MGEKFYIIITVIIHIHKPLHVNLIILLLNEDEVNFFVELNAKDEVNFWCILMFTGHTECSLVVS